MDGYDILITNRLRKYLSFYVLSLYFIRRYPVPVPFPPYGPLLWTHELSNLQNFPKFSTVFIVEFLFL